MKKPKSDIPPLLFMRPNTQIITVAKRAIEAHQQVARTTANLRGI